MDKVFKFVLAFLLIPLVVAFVAVAGQMLLHDVPWGELQWALIGMMGYVLVYPLIRTNNLQFVEIFEHELGHMVTYLGVFYRLKNFHVFPEEREHYVSAYRSGIPGVGWLTKLAPYFLPVFTIPLLLLHFVLPEQFIPALDFAIGLSLGFHFVALSREFRPIQTDLTEQTMFFSAVFTIFANTMLVMIIIGVLTRDSALLLEYLQTAAGQAGTYYTEIFDWLRTQDFAAML